MKRYLLLLACLSALALVAGCGGGGGGGEGLSKEDYEQQMQALQEKLSSTGDELSSAFEDTTDIAAMTEGLRQAADLLDEASSGLAEIGPPDDVAEAHQTMVDKSASAADRIREFADAIAEAPLAELQSKLQEFQEIEEFTALQEAVDEIEGKGYDIGGDS